MMDLRTVKEIATLRAQLGPLQRQVAERLKLAVDQAKANAVTQFNAHFTRAGFTLTGESRRYAASYEGMQFFLEIAETPGPESYFQFSVHPPAVLGEAKAVVQMVRKRDPAIEPPVAAEKINVVGAAQRALADAKVALSSPAPGFSYILIEEESVDGPDARAHNVSAPVYETFAEFLDAVYPH